MKKKHSQTKSIKDDKALTLGDRLNEELMAKLKNTKQQLKADEEKQREEEEKRKRDERKLREKNKTFEELLSESELNWQEYK